MYRLLTVIRRRPEIEVAEFREFMRDRYGPTYAAMPQTRSYVQHYLTDLMTDGAEAAIDAIVEIAFDSEDDMRAALDTEGYRRAHELRQSYMQETSVGIHSARVDESVRLV
jgi:hypothetical protein